MARGTRTALERTGFDVCTGGCTGARAIVVGSAIALREPIELAELRRRRSLFVTPQSYRFSGTAHRSLLACADVRDMPFADDAFDVIVDIGTLYHIARPDRWVQDLGRPDDVHGRRRRAPWLRCAAPRQLLDVTMEIVAEQGFQAVSIQSVAQRAGISRPIVYEHFGDLSGLLEALVEREMARALAQVSETMLGDLTGGDPSELMLESLRTYLGAVEHHPTTWPLELMPPEGAPDLLRKSISRGRVAVLIGLAEAKLRARGISLESVEQVRHNAHVIARNPHPRVPGARFLIGKTDGGEVLTLAIQPDASDPSEWHVMTGWPATDAQTALFRRHV